MGREFKQGNMRALTCGSVEALPIVTYLPKFGQNQRAAWAVETDLVENRQGI